MSSKKYATKTEIYQRIKKPLLERQRRARINKCLDDMKQFIVDLNGNCKILRMDKAEMLEHTIVYLRQNIEQQQFATPEIIMDSFQSGYMNAVNEVSRILASTPGMNVGMGKTVMKHLGRSYNRLQLHYEQNEQKQQQWHIQAMRPLAVDCPLSPASSGYHSDDNNSPAQSPTTAEVWRPW